MAKCTVKNVEVPVTVTKEVNEYTLVLSEEEAAVLKFIIGKISGYPSRSPRKHTDNIYYALENSGITGQQTNKLQGEGSIWLCDYKENK